MKRSKNKCYTFDDMRVYDAEELRKFDLLTNKEKAEYCRKVASGYPEESPQKKIIEKQAEIFSTLK
jgi:hypothetical protein